MGIRIVISNMKEANKYVKEIWQNYKKFASPAEYMFDRCVPMVIGCLVSVLTITFTINVKDILSIFKDFNNAALSVIAILAGFNTASLSVIAASNTKVLGKLASSERRDADNSSSTLLLQTVSLFGYSIVSELAILILGVLLIFILHFFGMLIEILPTVKYMYLAEKFTIGMLAIPWVAVIFHSLFLSVRNVIILYKYVLLLGHEAKNENNGGGI